MSYMPLVLVPAFFVPVFIILHLCALFQSQRLAAETRKVSAMEEVQKNCDPMMKVLGGDEARRRLVEGAWRRPGQRILDIGCGTGSLLILIKQLYPERLVIGLDPDPKALARARRKAEKALLSIQFDQGFSHKLPYDDASIDRVFDRICCITLRGDEKKQTFKRFGAGCNRADFFAC